MKLRGGPSEKTGFWFEHLWTIACILEIIAGDAISIHLEPSATSGKESGFEFTLTKKDCTEYHQVKRRRTNKNNWSLGDLDSEGILKDFHKKIHSDLANNFCHFVSMQNAADLSELVERATAASSFDDFNILINEKQRKEFIKLHSTYLTCSAHEAFLTLKNIKVNIISEDVLRKLINLESRRLFQDEPELVQQELTAMITENFLQKTDAKKIHNRLERKGFRWQDLAKDEVLLNKIIKLNQIYIATTTTKNHLTIGETFHTDVISGCLDWFNNAKAKSCLIISGMAGSGKSYLMGNVVRVLNEAHDVLAFRIDNISHSNVSTTDKLGKELLGIDLSPVKILANAYKDKPILLAIDQLDTVSMISGRNPRLLELVNELYEEIKKYPNIKLLLCCRKYDLEKDKELKSLRDESLMLVIPELKAVK